MSRTFILQPMPHPSRRLCAEYVMQAPDGWAVVVKEPTRSLEQNAAQWPILEAFSQQLQWPVNGQMVTMTADEWKDVLTAAFERESVRLAMAFDGPIPRGVNAVERSHDVAQIISRCRWRPGHLGRFCTGLVPGLLRAIPFKVPAREPVSWGNEEATGERDLGSGD